MRETYPNPLYILPISLVSAVLLAIITKWLPESFEKIMLQATVFSIGVGLSIMCVTEKPHVAREWDEV